MDGRTRSREARRDHVVSVASDLFNENGYDETTVEDIAEAAGVSPRSFYRYFDSKDGVLAALGSDVIGDALERLQDGGVEDPTISDIGLLLGEVADERIDEPRFAMFIRLLREHPELIGKAGVWRGQWAEQLAVGLSRLSGSDEPTPSHEVTARIAVAVVAVALDRWVEEPDGTPIRARVGDVLADLAENLR